MKRRKQSGVEFAGRVLPEEIELDGRVHTVQWLGRDGRRRGEAESAVTEAFTAGVVTREGLVKEVKKRLSGHEPYVTQAVNELVDQGKVSY